MLRSLKEVQADDSVVGFYQATTLGAFLNQSLVDTQAIHEERLRHGGVVIVHGTFCALYIWPLPLLNPCSQIFLKLRGEMHLSERLGLLAHFWTPTRRLISVLPGTI